MHNIHIAHGRQYSETYFIEILCFQRKQYFSLLTLSKSINNVKQNISVKMSNGKKEKKNIVIGRVTLRKVLKNVGHNVRKSFVEEESNFL